MNRDTVEGKFDQLKGKAKQSIGEALGNDKLANSGTVDQVKGAAKEVWGNAKDTFHAVAGEAHAASALTATAKRPFAVPEAAPAASFNSSAPLPSSAAGVRETAIPTAAAVLSAVHASLPTRPAPLPAQPTPAAARSARVDPDLGGRRRHRDALARRSGAAALIVRACDAKTNLRHVGGRTRRLQGAKV